VTKELVQRLNMLAVEMENMRKWVPDALGGVRSFVRVNSRQYTGVGVFLGMAEGNPTKVDVLIGNGNVWSYPAVDCQRARPREAPVELRQLYLRRRGVKCSGSTLRRKLNGSLP
jgi:hypothetical protein